MRKLRASFAVAGALLAGLLVASVALAAPSPAEYGERVSGDHADSAIARAASDERVRDLRALRPGDEHVHVRRMTTGQLAVLYEHRGRLVIAATMDPQAERVLGVAGSGSNIMPSANPYAGDLAGSPWAWLASAAALALLLAPARTAARRPSRSWLAAAAVLSGTSLVMSLYMATAPRTEAFPLGVKMSYALAYLLVLTAAVGCLRSRRARAPGRWLLSGTPLVVLVVLLVGMRGAAVAVDGEVSDVGRAGATGAELVRGGVEVYGNITDVPGFLRHGDTYPPFNYLAYVPAHAAIDLVADEVPLAAVAKVTAIWADLAAMVLIGLAGARIVGRQAGLRAAGLWAASGPPLLALLTATNDALVAALVAASVLVLARPAWRGALIAAAAWTKFAPALAVPVLLRVGPGGSRRSIARYVAGLCLASAVPVLLLLRHPDGLVHFWEATVGRQAERDPVNSLWAMLGVPSLGRVFVLLAVAAALLLALRRAPAARDAIGAIVVVLALVQLGLRAWWFTYLVWLLPALAVWLVAATRADEADAGYEGGEWIASSSPLPRSSDSSSAVSST